MTRTEFPTGINNMEESSVEQTIKYALQQKYVEGYNDASNEINKLRKELAQEIMLMEHPPITGQFADSWTMFRYVRNEAAKIVNGNESIFDD